MRIYNDYKTITRNIQYYFHIDKNKPRENERKVDRESDRINNRARRNTVRKSRVVRVLQYSNNLYRALANSNFYDGTKNKYSEYLAYKRFYFFETQSRSKSAAKIFIGI